MTASAPQRVETMNGRNPFFAKAYKLVLSASATYTPGLEAVFYNAHNEFTWQSTVLLAPLDPADDDATVRATLAATATYLDIWLMRRTVNYIRVGYSSVAYAMWLLAKDTRRKPLADLVTMIEDKLASDDVTFEGSAARDRKGIDDLAVNQLSRRYIFHLLARMVAFTEIGAGRADPFPDLVDRNRKNPFDIEHIWANKRQLHGDVFDNDQEFVALRNSVPALLLLPADVNRSLQDKPYAEKLGKYVSHHLYTASLSEAPYANQPQFDAFRDRLKLPFRSHVTFNKADLAARRALVSSLVAVIWSPSRIAAVLPATGPDEARPAAGAPTG